MSEAAMHKGYIGCGMTSHARHCAGAGGLIGEQNGRRDTRPAKMGRQQRRKVGSVGAVFPMLRIDDNDGPATRLDHSVQSIFERVQVTFNRLDDRHETSTSQERRLCRHKADLVLLATKIWVIHAKSGP